MELRDVKQRFFALRNGLLADNLRKQCALPQRMIFGLNLPQIKEIAAEAGKDSALADTLWTDVECRESRLLAPMVSPEQKPQWLAEVRTPEEADILCHSLLRHDPDAEATATSLTDSPDPLQRYAALRLLFNLLPASMPAVEKALATLPPHPLTTPIAAQLRQEIDFLAKNS